MMFKDQFIFYTFLSCLSSINGGSVEFATCRQACQDVGVQLKTSAVSSPIMEAKNAKFKEEVNAKVFLMAQAWDAKIRALQENQKMQIENILKAIQDLKTELQHTRQAMCPLPFNGKCYWAVFEKNMNYSKAKEICARVPGGNPSNIYGHDHLFVVLRYLRSLVRRNQSTVYAWLGMTVDPETENVSFRGGGTPRYLKWRPYQPDFTLSYTQLMIMARTDGNRKQEGLYNQNPAYKKLAVLCEV